MTTQRLYKIRVEGHLDHSWSTWFEGLTIRHLEAGETILSGPIADQAALHGVFIRIRDLGLPLIEVKQLDEHQQGRSATIDNLLSEQDTLT